jgi:hypothetical protein
MIKRMTAAAIAAAMAFACALAAFNAPAEAAVTNPACSNLPVANGATTYQECSYGNGTNIWLEHMPWGWDYTGLQPHPFAVDPVTGDQIVNIGSGGPTGYTLETGHMASVDADVGARTDAGSTATDTTPVSLIAALKGQVIELKTVASNTAKAGSLGYVAVPTPATYGTAMPAGAYGTQFVLQTASDSINYAVEASTICGVSAPVYIITATGSAAGVSYISENLAPGSGLAVCLISKAGNPGVRGD